MSSAQKWSRCRRQTSRSICRHSPGGSTATRTRARSIQPLLRDGASDCAALSCGSALRFAGSARSRLPSRTTSVVRSSASTKRSTLSTSGSARSVSKSKSSRRRGRLLVAAASVRADDRQQRPDHLVAGDPRDLPELAFGHRKRGHAAHDAGQVDAHRRGRLLRGGLGGGGGILRLQPFRRRIERRRRAGLQRDQVRPRGARERQLELHAVVHRVERAHRQEVQVAALRVERGRVVAELRLRDERRGLVRDVVELDRAVPRVGPELVRDPAGVRRPREVLGASRVAAVDHGQRAGVDVAQQHLVAMVGDRHLRAARRRAQLDHAAHVPRQHARRAVLPHVHALLARLVADGDERRAVGEPLPVAMPRAFRRAVLAHRAFPQPERDELAAHVEREAVPRRMHGESAQVVRGGHELARRLRAMRGHVDRDPARRVRLGIEAPQVRAALVDDARAVGLRVPRVEVVVIGVPAPVRAVGLARVEIAHALGVRQVVHAVADPHRARDVAGQFRHPPERAAAVRVDPQVPGRAAAIALPARGVRRVAADDLRVAGSQREVIDLSQRQQLRHAARGVERERAVVAEERLAVRRHEEHVPFRRPAAHHHVGPEPRQAPRRAAFGRHHVDLRVLLVAADERELRAVGRNARRGRLPQSCRQAPRDAAVGAHRPQVVVADEDERIAADRGMTQISLLAHGVGVHACERPRIVRSGRVGDGNGSRARDGSGGGAAPGAPRRMAVGGDERRVGVAGRRRWRGTLPPTGSNHEDAMPIVAPITGAGAQGRRSHRRRYRAPRVIGEPCLRVRLSPGVGAPPLHRVVARSLAKDGRHQRCEYAGVAFAHRTRRRRRARHPRRFPVRMRRAARPAETGRRPRPTRFRAAPARRLRGRRDA